MNIIKTTAPIPFEELKKYFEDDTTVFEIDISNSEIKSDKLLTYVGNLDLPIDLTWEKEDDIQELLKAYFKSNILVNLPQLEEITLDILNELKYNENIEDKFILENKNILLEWLKRFDLLVAYSMHTTNLYSNWINKLPKNTDNVTEGINFVALLKYPEVISLINPSKDFQPEYNESFFDGYIFKGKNLYYYWANENNPLFLFHEAILGEEITGKEYAKIVTGEKIDE